MSKITRNDFLKWMGGGALLALAACDDGGGSDMPMIDAPPGNCVTGNATTMIGLPGSENHAHAPHMVVVSSADIAAGVDKEYSIRGNASHDHTFTITAAQFTMMLQTGGSIMVATSVDTATGHMHTVTVSCG